MEVLLSLIVVALCMLSFLIHNITELVKQLKTGNSTRLSKGFEARLLVAPINEKSEVDPQKSNSASSDNEK